MRCQEQLDPGDNDAVEALLSFAVALGVLAVLDAIWLGVVTREYYTRRLKGLLLDKPIWAVAIVFYVIHAAGIAVFAVPLSVVSGTWTAAILYGGFFGFCCYAAYDLTNLATLRGWPVAITLVDLAWGTAVSAAATVAAYAAVKT